MAIDTTYTEARANLAKLLDRVTNDQEVVFIRRRGREKVALVAADELESLMETAHLLRSPRNAAQRRRPRRPGTRMRRSSRTENR